MYGYLGTRIQNSLSATKLSLNIYFYAFFISNVVMCSLILAHCGGEGGGQYFFILFLFVYYTFQSVLVSNMNFNDFFIFFLFYLVNAQESRGVNALSKKSF